MSLALCSSSDISTYFPQLASLSYLDSLITVASDIVYSYCNRTTLITASGVVERVDGSKSPSSLGFYGITQYYNNSLVGTQGNFFLVLKNFPIVSVQSVVDDAGTSITDYVILHSRGLLYRQYGWNPGIENYTVTYTCGNAADRVKHAAILMVKHLYDDMLLGTGGQIRTRTLGDSSIEYFEAPASQLPMYVQLLLNPFRKIPV
ncbi:MAG: hypothetical protein JWN86_1772 [Planctomycetota bacterium]|nr:hypothetical protein [Planctomycetota bacterium]